MFRTLLESIILVSLLVQFSIESDILNFNWSTLNTTVVNRNRSDYVESEFGTIVLANDTINRLKTTNTSKRLGPMVPTRKKINDLLKGYLSKLYEVNNKVSEPSSAVVLPTPSLWNLKQKTALYAKKLLSLFTIIQFPNAKCGTTSDEDGYEGTCFHQSECERLGGTALGDCANGYGACCVFKISCGGTTVQNCTYFESPNYPDYDPPMMVLQPSIVSTPDPRLPALLLLKNRQLNPPPNSSLSCTINIVKVVPEVQQIRIDFIDLELAGPEDGTCVTEGLVISGTNLGMELPMVLCGYNTGQHLLVDVSGTDDPVELAILSSTGESKRFKIRICQLVDNCYKKNCLQYYTGTSGVISSFNYEQAQSLFNRSTPGYLNSLNYAICIQKESGYCSITYTNLMVTPNGTVEEYPFQIINVNNDGLSTVPPDQAGADAFNCPDDYIVLNGIRLCGDRLNDGTNPNIDFTMSTPIRDFSNAPVIVYVRSDETISGRGFKLFYTQNKC